MEMSRALFLIDILYEENKTKCQEIKNKIVEAELKSKLVLFDTINRNSIGTVKLDYISNLYDKIQKSDTIYYIADYDIEKYYHDRPFSSLIDYSIDINKDIHFYPFNCREEFIVLLTDVEENNFNKLIDFRLENVDLKYKVYEININENNLQNKTIDDDVYIKLNECNKVYIISDKLYNDKIICKEGYELVRHASLKNKPMESFYISNEGIKKINNRGEENNMEDMKTITICGSTKQKDQILKLKTILENKGYRVFTPEFDVKSPNECVMFSIHKVKMDSSDIIYFLLKPLTDISHQAGTGMQKEIQYAIRQEKNIRFITPEEIDFLSSKENTDIVCNQN